MWRTSEDPLAAGGDLTDQPLPGGLGHPAPRLLSSPWGEAGRGQPSGRPFSGAGRGPPTHRSTEDDGPKQGGPPGPPPRPAAPLAGSSRGLRSRRCLARPAALSLAWPPRVALAGARSRRSPQPGGRAGPFGPGRTILAGPGAVASSESPRRGGSDRGARQAKSG